MNPLTYRQLKEALNELTEDQLDMSVTAWFLELKEAVPVTDTILVSELSENEYDE